MKKPLSIQDLTLQGKKVLIRVDFNVPLDDVQSITDDSRIKAAIPSIQYVLDHGGSAILMSHLGRPKEASPKYSLLPCATRLEELLKRPVIMAKDSIGKQVEELASNLLPGQVLMLENLRFHAGEEHPENDPSFAKNLAKLGNVYINDAFGTAHRAHASTAEIARYFPGQSASGFLLEKEIAALGQLLEKPARPFYALIGGAKISSKLGAVKSLIEKVDALLIGGGMAYTFLKAEGMPIGNSICEETLLDEAKEIIEICKSKGIKLFLPQDFVIAKSIKEAKGIKTVTKTEGIPDDMQGVDIGPKTTEQYIEELKKAKTVFWNGPLGVFEVPAFAKGTEKVAKAMSELSATTVIGGGESVAAVEAAGVANKMSHISTGGGASLEFLELGSLPGIDALSKK